MYALIKNEEVTKMHEIINKIVQQNQSLFGTNPKIDKINIGVFNPEGVRCLQEDENIEPYVFYVRAAGK